MLVLLLESFVVATRNLYAVALPMPDVPPVTSATLPENVLLFIVFLSFVAFEFSW
jgi:hypothetical protein